MCPTGMEQETRGVHHCTVCTIASTTVVRCTGYHVRLRARCGNNRTWQTALRQSERAMTQAESIMPGRARRSRQKRPCWQRGVHNICYGLTHTHPTARDSDCSLARG